MDFRNDGYTLLTGSYRQADPIQLWDLRTFKCFRTIDWDGPVHSVFDPDVQGEQQEDEEREKRYQAPAMLYGCAFNRK